MTDKGKKFFFDLHDFEKEAEEEKEKRKNKTPPAPSFSLEDMEEARKASFDKGKEHGLQLARDSIEQRTELMVQSLADHVQALERAEQKRTDDYLAHSVAMTYKALKRLLQPLLDQKKEELIKAALIEFFAETTRKADMTLFIHPSMTDAISRHAQNLSSALAIKADNAMDPSQVRVEWASGIFEFKPDRLMEQILQTLEGRVENADLTLDDPSKKPHTTDMTSTKEQDS